MLDMINFAGEILKIVQCKLWNRFDKRTQDSSHWDESN